MLLDFTSMLIHPIYDGLKAWTTTRWEITWWSYIAYFAPFRRRWAHTNHQRASTKWGMRLELEERLLMQETNEQWRMSNALKTQSLHAWYSLGQQLYAREWWRLRQGADLRLAPTNGSPPLRRDGLCACLRRPLANDDRKVPLAVTLLL